MHQSLARGQPAGGSDSRVSVLRVKNCYLFIFAAKYTSHKICSFNHQWHWAYSQFLFCFTLNGGKKKTQRIRNLLLWPESLSICCLAFCRKWPLPQTFSVQRGDWTDDQGFALCSRRALRALPALPRPPACSLRQVTWVRPRFSQALQSCDDHSNYLPGRSGDPLDYLNSLSERSCEWPVPRRFVGSSPGGEGLAEPERCRPFCRQPWERPAWGLRQPKEGTRT